MTPSKIHIAIPVMQPAFRCSPGRASALTKQGLAKVLEVSWDKLDYTANNYDGHQKKRVRKILKDLVHDVAK